MAGQAGAVRQEPVNQCINANPTLYDKEIVRSTDAFRLVMSLKIWYHILNINTSMQCHAPSTQPSTPVGEFRMKTRMKTTFRFTTGLVLLFALLLGVLGRASAQTTDTTPGPARYCQGEAATIVYIGYDSTVSGTDGDDVIYIEGGWNYVYADSGDDKVCIFGHFNTVYGGDGDDILVVGGLYNELYGDAGDDALQVDSATNALDGGGDAGDRCNGGGC